MLTEKSSSNIIRRPKLGSFFSSISNKTYSSIDDDLDLLSDDTSPYSASPTTSSATPSQEFSPYLHNVMSPWNNSTTTPLSLSAASSFTKSPWLVASSPFLPFGSQNGLIGSIVREEGHIYSLATSGDLLYTGSDSKNVRVWKNLKSFSGFKCSSGLVKTIVISGEKIFTGHQDGKIRIWKISRKDETLHKRIGSLPNFSEFVKKSFNPKNYVEVRRKKNVLRIKHYDAVSCMSLNEEQGLLYSGSWDKTLKVWRISDSKCLESVTAHDDAINAVVTGFHCWAFTGSADGTVKVWKRENTEWKDTRHTLVQVLLKQEYAVTALTVNSASTVVYAASSDGLVNFWERGKQLIHGGVLRGHKLAVLCLATSGSLVLSGGADKNICVWKREEGGIHTCLSVFTGHTGPVKCLAVDEDREEAGGKVDGRWIVYSGSLDKSVKVWRVSEQLLRPDFMQIPQGPK